MSRNAFGILGPNLLHRGLPSTWTWPLPRVSSYRTTTEKKYVLDSRYHLKRTRVSKNQRPLGGLDTMLVQCEINSIFEFTTRQGKRYRKKSFVRRPTGINYVLKKSVQDPKELKTRDLAFSNRFRHAGDCIVLILTTLFSSQCSRSL